MFSLETNRLQLRRFSPEDWRDLYDYMSQELAIRYEPCDVFSEEGSKELAIRHSNNEALWAVCLKSENKVIGNLYFKQQEPIKHDTWEIGYIFNATYWGQGYAIESCYRMFQHAFEELGAHRIIAKCNANNTSSWKLMERLDMHKEGHFKNSAYVHKGSDGTPLWHDEYFYSILRDQFK